MIDLSAKRFFNLSSFNHRGIFFTQNPAWEALVNLEIYLRKYFAKNVLSDKDIFIGKGTVIEKGAMIKGPAIIGDNCEIRHTAYIRGGVIIGHGCVIGHASEIKHSILLNNVQTAHFNYIGDSILGNKVNLGGGSILANLRLDKKEVKIDYRGKKVSTGLIKLGSILSDNVSIGCQVVCNPGAILEENCQVYPLTNVKGYHSKNSIIR